jgi:hypothetical protein
MRFDACVIFRENIKATMILFLCYNCQHIQCKYFIQLVLEQVNSVETQDQDFAGAPGFVFSRNMCTFINIILCWSASGVSCDSCLKGNFRGRRYKCLICYDYDLCATCYEAGATTTRHTTEHPMQCILTRSDFGRCNSYAWHLVFEVSVSAYLELWGPVLLPILITIIYHELRDARTRVILFASVFSVMGQQEGFCCHLFTREVNCVDVMFL